jgi:SagB-type dehydrogenase family enzyme
MGVPAVLAFWIGMTACSGGEPAASPSAASFSPGSPAVGGSTIVLPSPRTEGDVSLEEALANRRSVRAFESTDLTLDEISQLLWAAQGITAEWGGRTAPSAGALYPLEVYVATADGVYHYLPEGHRAEVISRADLRGALAHDAVDQSFVAEAPAVFVITAVFARTSVKYGERAQRYVTLEAGHVAQNILLEATALGLAGVPVGAFSDAGVRETLGLPSNHAPLYLLPVGRPAEV